LKVVFVIRFFVSPADISGDLIRLSADDAAHIRSLRLRPAETFAVCCGDGLDYICKLGERGDGSTAEIVDTRPSLGEPSVSCGAYIAWSSGDRLDYAVQKSVELGAREVVLFPSHRCEAVPRDAAKKTARLQRIALETAKQCGRGIVPRVAAAGSFDDAVGQAALAGLPLFLYEREDDLHLKQALEQSSGYLAEAPQAAVSVMTGPAGGFEPFEAERAKASGMVAVTLGARILRCETAPVIALAVVMFHTGNL